MRSSENHLRYTSNHNETIKPIEQGNKVALKQKAIIINKIGILSGEDCLC